MEQPTRTFKVSVETMYESHRITYVVTLVNSLRPADAKFWDQENLVTPFITEKLEYAKEEAAMWAKFLGCEMKPYTPPSNLEEYKATLRQKGYEVL